MEARMRAGSGTGKMRQGVKALLRAGRASLRALAAPIWARRHVARLFADVNRLSPAEWEAYAGRIRALCAQRGYDAVWSEVWASHRYRLYLTVTWLKELFPQTGAGLQALELGGASIVSDLLREEFPGWQLRNTMGDLRQPLEFGDDSMDVVIATEVLEHLADLPQGYNDSFVSSGARALLGECRRVLKPGGILFATTPNAGSIIHLHRALTGKEPRFYSLHVREYTAGELTGMAAEAGLEVLRCEDVHCLTVDLPFDHFTVFQTLEAYNFPTQGRGDDLFLAARKPGSG